VAKTVKDITPLHDNVVLQIIERNERSKGGIYIPPNAKDQELAWKAEVLAVGPGRLLDNGRRVEPDVRKGDTVILGKYMGNEVEIDGHKVVIVKEEHLLGVIEEDN
jgi:chaperonin GroES